MKYNKFNCGLILGAIAGILFAPASGYHTRKKVTNSYLYLKNKIQNIVGNEETNLEELKEEISQLGDEINSDLKYKLNKLIDKTQKEYEKQKKEMI